MSVIKSILFFLFFVNFLFGQSPNSKQWDYRYGGNSAEIITTYRQTTDGGYLLGGHSSSAIDGNKTQPTQGGFDYWVVKLDSLGIMQWDKDFGGFDDELLYVVEQTTDGGFILGGTSYSGMSGDKTDTSRGGQDYWVVKIDAAGNKEWDKTYGGDNIDWLYSLTQTTDGGYMLGGYSYSGVGGEKTQPSLGSKDYWIIKIDTAGNKIWDKSYGGTDDDWFYELEQTTDSGFILAGFSNSGISGDKSQPTWGFYDCWIIKIDQSGNKQWDKDFGGTSIDGLNAIEQTADGGYVFGGPSLSGIGGDKTQASWGAYDFWIIKTDAAGNKVWDKNFGGTANEEVFCDVVQTSDLGYLVSGLSYSGLGGDKSENNLGAEQAWIIKTDAAGNKQWDKTIFTPGHDEGGFGMQSEDGCYVIASFNSTGIGGYKSQPAWNNTDDYWIVKFCDSLFNAVEQISEIDFTVDVSPNPFTNTITCSINKKSISSAKSPAKINIRNLLGNAIFISSINTSGNSIHETINMADIAPGIYFIEIAIESQKIVKKIIRQ